MCTCYLSYGPVSSSSFFRRSWPSKRHLRFGLINRKKAQWNEAKQRKLLRTGFELKNLKLYMENQSLIEENEKLRKKAMLLRRENQDLSSQLQDKLSQFQQNNNGSKISH